MAALYERHKVRTLAREGPPRDGAPCGSTIKKLFNKRRL